MTAGAPVLHARERAKLFRVLNEVFDASKGPGPELLNELERVIEHAFRSIDLGQPTLDSQLSPHLSDGVILRDVGFSDPTTLTALGWVWMVDSQRCTPMSLSASRVRGGLRVELRHGIAGMLFDTDELDRMWRRGRLPGPDADWLVVVEASDDGGSAKPLLARD